jgi:hypothetical protein
MSDSITKRKLVDEAFCWDEFVESQVAKLTPEEVRQIAIWRQLGLLGLAAFVSRDESGRSIEEVAKASGVKAIHINRLENFGPYPTLEQFVSVVHELGGEVIVVKRSAERLSIVLGDHQGC